MRFKGVELTDQDAERFWTKVDRRGENDCWLWTASVSPKGYGKFGFSRGGVAKTFVASQVALALAGVDITGAVLHHCDTPACCNPAHLYVGSALRNVQDAIERGRFGGFTATGSCRHGHKRTAQNTREYVWQGQVHLRCRDCERERPRTRREVGTHGTRGGYVAGCRCDDCTEANRTWNRGYARRRRKT